MRKEEKPNLLFSKRAQITAFVIIAIVIIAVISIVIYFNKTQSKTKLESVFSKLEIKTEASKVQYSILECLEETSKDSLAVIGIQGGYYNKPEKSFDLGWAFIPYYYYEGVFSMPTIEKIEQELSSYINDNIKTCIENLQYDEFNIIYSISETKSLIGEKDVSFETDLTMNFKKSDLSSEFELNKYPVKFESALSDILEVASYITESHKEDPDMCISCVLDMAEERNLYVYMIDFGDETTTLIVISENYTSSDPYVFEFLNKYSVKK